MLYRESPPSEALRGYIKLFWSLEYDPAVDELETVLPDGCPEIVFNLADRFERIEGEVPHLQPRTLFAGQMSRRITIRPTGKVRLWGVRFHPSGAFPLVRFPMRELNNEILDVAECLSADSAELEEKINACGTFEERKDTFERFLTLKLASRGTDNFASSRVVQRIVEKTGSISVGTLAREIGSSERSLERLFQWQVGISPKLLSRLIRFQSFISIIQKADSPGNLEALLDLGYFDQSHAIRDFREFSGTTPMTYFRMTHGLSDVFTGRHA